MEKLDDVGFILNRKKYDTHAYILSIFSSKHGIVKGFIKANKDSEKFLMPCNLIKFSWSARIDGQLGTLKIEMLKSYGTLFLASRRQVYIANMLLPLLINSLQEKIPYDDLFDNLTELWNMYNNTHYEVFSVYILFEFALLRNLGFGINLDKCNISGYETVKYISPVSGNAVSAAIALGYESKLFEIPDFILNNATTNDITQIIAGEKIARFFLKKFLFSNLSHPREEFASVMLEFMKN